MSEWKEVTLHEIGTLARGKSKHRPRWADHLYGGVVPFIQTGDIRKANKLISEFEQTYSSEGVAQSKLWKKGTLCITIAANIAEIGILDFDACFPDSVLGFIPDKNYSTTDFVFYLLKHFQKQIQIQSIGSVQENINLGTFERIKFPIPPLPEQKAIAHILGILDEKIELNRKMNQTLEAMAQALFKSWFVDFDPVIDNALAQGNEIPEKLQARAEKRRVIAGSVIASAAKQSPNEGETKQSPSSLKLLLSTNPSLAAQFPASFVFNETLGKWIPEGWEVRILGELIKLIGGGTPNTSIGEYWNGNIPWFSVVDAPNNSDVFVIGTEKKVTEEGVKNSSTQILRVGTTIISARGTVGKCAIVGVPMAMNQSCYGIQSINSNEDIFTYLLVRKNVSDLQNKSHGSVFNTITRDTFNAIDIVSPPNRNIIHVFESSLKYNFEKIKSNLFENQTLTQLRDRLLPELISGRVRVREGIVNS